MRYDFSDCRLDVDARELRRAGAVVPVEPQVFDLLRVLVEHRGRVLTRDELIDLIWSGRAVSDSAVSSRIKSARQAIGDDGDAQRLIRTHHGIGFRFVGDVSGHAGNAAPEAEPLGGLGVRPSIAVLPFEFVGQPGPYAAVADALPHDLIVELSRLRWLAVIARGSSFQFRGARAEPRLVGAALGVRYVLSGVAELAGPRLAITVELSDTHDGTVIWCEAFQEAIGGVHDIRARIARTTAAALDLQIPLSEARRAFGDPENLDAWAAFHLGLNQAFRFNRDGAQRAQALFEHAVAREPGFARAHAGLSFVQFEGAFLSFAADRQGTAEQARRSAEASLVLDPLDPFCNLVMGRAQWLTGDLEDALPWLDRAVELNPNYAQGRYSNAWTRTLLGEGRRGQSLVDDARALSPMDPLLYGMLAVRAFSHIVLDEPAEAADWGERAARAPRAHPLIEMIAAVAHELNGDRERAKLRIDSACRKHPELSSRHFHQAFPFQGLARDRIDRVLSELT